MTADEIGRAVAAALEPAHFFVASAHTLHIRGPAPERCAWEIFRGHLLDQSQTRQQRDFRSWHVFFDNGDEPLLSVKYDEQARCFYIVRSLRVFGHAAFESGGVIDSRPAEKWLRELIGSVRLDLVRDAEHLRELLERCVFLAVVGTSRLPITSLESPLPGFSLGVFAYGLAERAAGFIPAVAPAVINPAARCGTAVRVERAARSLEFLLRSIHADQREALLPEAIRHWPKESRPLAELLELSKSLFHHVALSPYTQFVDNWLFLLRTLAAQERAGPEAVLDTLGYMLRHLGRHLTAFDLERFHNRGANYPDALFLDAALRAYLAVLEPQPQAAGGGRCRRALRMGWVCRKLLEGVPVPDAPTSPGENLRVLPPPFARVAEEQLSDPRRRTRRLFAGEPAEELLTPRTRAVLAESMNDLSDPSELLELGMAVFLDRPLGVFKQPGEVDRTPLCSYEAFSRQIARQRVDDLHRWALLSNEQHGELVRRLDTLAVNGIPVAELTGQERRGIVALEDARRASADFLILRTTRSSLRRFWETYGPGPPIHEQISLLLRSPRSRLSSSPVPFLTGYDKALRPRIELGVVESAAGLYAELAGREFLAGGLRVLRVLDETGREISLHHELLLKPNFDRAASDD